MSSLNLILKKQNKFITSLLILSVAYLMISGNNLQNVSGKYNIKLGDIFRFHLNIFNDTSGNPKTLSISNLVFETGTRLSIEITYFELPYIKYTITIKGYYKQFAILSDVLVQNREWDDLTEEWASQGYTIYEDNEIWGVRIDNTTKLQVDYKKSDGVLNYFYAQNESQLESALNIGEIEFIRTGDNLNNNWAYSFLAVIPLAGLIVAIVIRKKRVRLREKKLLED